jgi:hypothetical protein
MNNSHLAWAKGHDWGRQAFLNKGNLFIANNGEETGGYCVIRGAWLEFDDLRDLLRWAGY